jgi:demethylmenaquinone methyltransferase/2-methoxy-6-polyprenyl-1,4-benzoquinol methylase
MTQAESASRFYDRISGVYDVLSDSSEQSARELGIGLLAPNGNQQLLEIGLGTGHGLVEIGKRLGSGGSVSGLDVSPGMLEVARRRVEAAGLGDRVGELRLGDAVELPYDAGSFDAVFMSFALELFSQEEIPRVLAQISRVLKTGGRLGVVAMHDDGGKSAIVDLYRFLHRHFPHIVDCQPIDVPSCLERAGFEVTARESLSIWGLPVLAVLAQRAGV